MRYESQISREDGSQVKIVTITSDCPMYGKQWDLFVLRRDSQQHDWAVCSPITPVGYKGMSKSEYEERGRSDMLKAASSQEILKHIKAVHDLFGSGSESTKGESDDSEVVLVQGSPVWADGTVQSS